jgi:hypothetical protein
MRPSKRSIAFLPSQKLPGSGDSPREARQSRERQAASEVIAARRPKMPSDPLSIGPMGESKKQPADPRLCALIGGLRVEFNGTGQQLTSDGSAPRKNSMPSMITADNGERQKNAITKSAPTS